MLQLQQKKITHSISTMFSNMQNMIHIKIHRFGATDYNMDDDSSISETENKHEHEIKNTYKDKEKENIYKTETGKEKPYTHFNENVISKKNKLPSSSELRKCEHIKCSDELITGLLVSIQPTYNGRYRVLYRMYDNIGVIIGELVKRNIYSNYYEPATIHDLVQCINETDKEKRKKMSVNVFFYSNVSEDIINDVQKTLSEI